MWITDEHEIDLLLESHLALFVQNIRIAELSQRRSPPISHNADKPWPITPSTNDRQVGQSWTYETGLLRYEGCFSLLINWSI